MSEVCPKCSVPYSGPANPRWAVCAACGHLWKPGRPGSAVTTPKPATPPPAAPPLLAPLAPITAVHAAPSVPPVAPITPAAGLPAVPATALPATPVRQRQPVRPDVVIQAGGESAAPVAPVAAPAAPDTDLPVPSVRPSASAGARVPTTDLPVTDVAKAPKPGSGSSAKRAATPGHNDSLEYDMGESPAAAAEAAALTLRRDAAAAAEAGGMAALEPRAPGEPPTPRPPRRDTTTGRRRRGGSEVDLDLFEKIEKEIGYERSEHRTVPDPDFVVPAVVGEDVSDRMHRTIACPICGGRVVVPPQQAEVACLQCDTVIDAASGLPASGSSGDGSGMHQPARSLIGSTIAGCYLDRLLGEGGMGAVFHARQLSLDRSVAIKVLPPELKRNRKFIRRFEQEAKALARINHPNILHIYDFGEDPTTGVYYMVMEFVDGEDLAESLRKHHRLPADRVLDILAQSASGLAMAAEKQVVHRDIKPDNLMLTREGVVKVSDFGLAKDIAAATEVTNVGMRVGTPAFMSPEQCDGKKLDFRSDIYSLGCTAYVALTGRLPFDGDSPFAIMLKHKSEPYPGLGRYLENVDPRLDRLVGRMMAKEPAERFGSHEELAQACLALQGSAASAEGAARPGTAPAAGDEDGPRGWRRRSSGLLPPLPLGTDGLPHLPTASASGGHGVPVAVAPPPPPVSPSPPLPPPVSAASLAAQLGPMAPAVVSASGSGGHERPEAAGSPRSSRVGTRASGETASPRKSSRRASATRSSGAHARPEGATGSGSGSRRTDTAIGEGTATLVARAERALKEGDYPQAVQHFQAAVQRHPANRQLHEQLAEARARSRASEVGTIEVEGDRLARAGRLREAIAAWQKAAQMGSEWRLRENLLQKVDRARGRMAALRRRRIVLGFVFVLLALIGGAYAAWPMAHQRLAERALAKVRPLTGEARVQALRELVDTWGEMPALWRRHITWRTYAIPAAETARAELALLTQHQQDVEQIKRRQAMVSALEAQADDAAVSWTQLLAEAGAVRDGLGSAPADLTARVQAVFEKAQDHEAAVQTRLREVARLLDDGKGVSALALAETLRREPRLGTLALRLPLPLAITVEGPDRSPLPQAVVRIDGVVLAEGRQGWRRTDRAVLVEATAPGLRGARQEVAAGREPATIVLRLDQGRVWAAGENARAGAAPWTSLHALDDRRVLLHGETSLVVVQAADGTVLARAARGAYAPAPDDARWSPFLVRSGNSLRIGTADGPVLQLTLGQDPPVLDGTPARAAGPVLDLIEHDLSFRAGERARATVVRADPATGTLAFRHLNAERDAWTFGPLPSEPRPVLFHRRDKLFLADRDRLHAFDEESGREVSLSFAGPRLGEPAWVAEGRLLAVVCGNRIELIGFPEREEMKTVADLDPGAPIVAAAWRGDLLLAATADGGLHLLSCAGGKIERRWTTRLGDASASARTLALGPSVAAAAAADGRISVIASDGRVLRTFEHGGPVLAVLPLADRLVVYGTAQDLSAYLLGP